MARAHGITLWGWWLAAAVSATIGSVAPTPGVQLALIAGWTTLVVLRRRHLWSMRPFAFALISAAVFVGMRMLYTALFGGVSPLRAEGTVLWVLPQFWLPGPFSGIHLFGTVSLEMLATAAGDALRFAVVFVAFGAASSLVDARRLLAHVPRRLASIGMTLSIALSMFTSVALLARNINRARLLRGERSRWRMLLPLFEQTLERSQAVALSMLSRGWQQRDVWDAERAARADTPRSEHPVVDVRNLSVAYGTHRVLRDISLTASAGTLTVITGATGSGKSTLLAQIRGSIEPGAVMTSGSVLVHGAPASLQQNTGLTTQRAERSFVAATVREELEFSAAPADAAQIAEQLGVAHLLSRRTEQLSAGEAALVAVAAACASQPKLLLLDEPIADLDQLATERLCDALRSLRAAGTAIIVVEHRPKILTSIADQVFDLAAGQLIRQDAAPTPVPAAAESPSRVASGPRTSTVECIEANAERIRSAKPGTITAVVGANGTGKTTLFENLALAGNTPNLDIALVSYNSDDYFFTPSLAEEFLHTDKLHGLNQGTTEGLVRRLVPELPPLDTHPRDCSAGTRVALAIALQLSLCRPILLLDEPTRGLDARARAELAGMLRETSVHQIAVVFATHDEDFVQDVADDVLRMPGMTTRNTPAEHPPTPEAAEVTHARE